jgi:hypothetical protein
MAVLRDLSVILLVITAALLGMVPLLVAGWLVYGFGRLQRHRNLPSWLQLARAYLTLGQAYVEFAMAVAARPVFLIGSASATVGGWWEAVARYVKKGSR